MGREQHREGEAGEVCCLPRQQGEDDERADEERPDEEHLREDREQEEERLREEALREHHQGLDRLSPEGPEGAELEGLRAGEREERAGPGLVREGEELLLQVSRSRLAPGRCFRRRSGAWGLPARCLSEGRPVDPADLGLAALAARSYLSLPC